MNNITNYLAANVRGQLTFLKLFLPIYGIIRMCLKISIELKVKVLLE